MSSLSFDGRLGFQQRVIPAYRAPFFELLGEKCQGGLCVFAGQPLPREGIQAATSLQGATLTYGKNRHLANPASPLYRCWQPDLLLWLENCQPDVLIVEANPRYPDTRRAITWMHARSRQVLGWGLGAPPVEGFLAGWRRRSRKSLLSQLDGVIAYSQRGAREYIALGMAVDEVFVAPNAATFRPPIPPSRPVASDERLKILFVGRLQRRKRIDLLLEVCARMPDDLQPELWIVGDGPALQEFKSMADRLYPRASFVGALHGPALEPYFSQADLFVLPGTGGLAVQQAMSHGLPVIVAQGDGTQDDLVRAANGWQVRPGDPDDLYQALASALGDRPRLRKMGAASYQIVAEEINLETMAAAFIDAVNTIQNGD